MSIIVLIPLDNRPCTFNFPKNIATIAGFNPILPPKEIIGDIKKPAKFEKLIEWLEQTILNNDKVDALIIAFDTLAYGGLVFSRKSELTFEQIIKRLNILKKIKRKYPYICIYGFSTIMRISNFNDNQEEKEYWKDYGKLIFRYSYLLHKLNKNIDFNNLNYNSYNKFLFQDLNINNEEYISIKRKIPHDILNDFFCTRLRNFKVNIELINWLKKDIINLLFINVDDSSKYGLNIIEKNIIKNNIKFLSLTKKCFVFPGTDEVLSIMVTRFINDKFNFIPKFYPIYSSNNSSKIITMYEGQTLGKTLKQQLKALNGSLVSDINNSDCVLFLHIPYSTQGDIFLKEKLPVYQNKSQIKKDIKKICEIKDKKNIAIADLAFANGSNIQFVEELIKNINLIELISYSSWNTTGNTLGTVISHSSVRLFSQKILPQDFNSILEIEKNHIEFLFYQFIDGRFQSLHRPPYETKVIDRKIILNNVKKDTINFFNKYLKSKEYSLKDKKIFFKILSLENLNIFFPWNRIFEIEFDFKIKIKLLL